MTTRHLQIFVKVADCGRMSEAAREMYITQPSVSQAIAEIEREYGVRLFERLGRSLYLTRTGSELLDYARHFLSLWEEMDGYLKKAAERMHLRVGAAVTVGTCVMSPIISWLCREFPVAQPEVFVANTHIIEERLLKSELDIGLVEGRITQPDLVVKQAIQDRMVLACGKNHPFFGRASVMPLELAHQPFVLREEGSGTRAQLENQLRLRQIPYEVKWTCYNEGAIKNAVMDGHGITVLSERLVRQEISEGRLWACGIEGLSLGRSFNLVYHKNKFFSEVLSCFVSVCERFGQEEQKHPHGQTP